MRNIAKSLVLIVAVAAVAGFATYSYFSDSATSGENTFSSGTLSINDSKLSDDTEIVLPTMAPGDVSEPYEIIIENNGNINLAWFGDWQFSGGISGDNNYDLKDALYIADAKMEFLADDDTNWLGDTADGYEIVDLQKIDHFITNGTGSGPYPGAYNALASASPFQVISFNKWNDNSSMVTTGPYEHAGALKPTYMYKLTVKFGMAAGAGNQYQNLGPVTAKLKVDATQIVASQIVALTGGWNDMTWLNNQIADQTE